MRNHSAQGTWSDDLGLAVAGALLLLLYAVAYLASSDRALLGPNDFTPLYVAGIEAGGSGLYDPEVYYRFEREQFGEVTQAIIYVRPPYYAVVFKPLTWLGSYESAYAAYSVLRLAAIAAFLWLWPSGRRREAALLTCMSFPLFSSMMNGQDVVFLLPLIALALRWERNGRPFAAGAAFALCAPKFHLLLLLPAALAAQRRWDVLQGLAAGAAGLIFVSFVTAGATWPLDYAGVLAVGEPNQQIEIMPNLRGLFVGVRSAGLWEAAGAAAALAAVVFAARREDLAFGLAAACLGSLLVSHHSYVADMTLLLPGLLATTAALQPFPGRLLALTMLSPIPAVLLLSERPFSVFGQAIIIGALLGYVATKRSRARGSIPSPLNAPQ